MEHLLKKPWSDDCQCKKLVEDHQEFKPCPVCEWGANICKICGLVEYQLCDTPECPGPSVGYFSLTNFIEDCKNFEPNIIVNGIPLWAQKCILMPVYKRSNYFEVRSSEGDWYICSERWVGKNE